MASSKAEKVFNKNNVKSAKMIFNVCPKFIDYMTLNRSTNAAIKSHPCKFTLPIIQLPDKVDRAAAKYLRDEVVTKPQHLVQNAIGLRNALWSRLLLIEKNIAEYVIKNIKKNTIQPPNVDFSEDELQEIEGSGDYNLEELLINNAANIMQMHKSDVKDMIKREMEDLVLPIRYSLKLSNLYLVARLAPNFAASCRVFYEIRKRCPKFNPETLFDFGSGVGSATWAANSVWPSGTIKEHFLVDASTHFLSISEYLLKDGFVKKHNTAFPGVTFRSYLPASNESMYDIVVSCYSLLDITGGYMNRRYILSNLWNKTSKFLVLIDNGTKAGFQAILEARNWLLESTKNDANPAVLFAPCPHKSSCAKAESVCSFNVKYEKLRLTESMATVSNEMFSYVIFHKGDISEYQDGNQDIIKDYPRIVSYKVKNEVQDLCTKDGEVVRYYLSTKERSMKQFLKKCNSGDLMPLIKI